MFRDGISLIIITYNRASDLDFTLSTIESVFPKCQYEIIIVDNCSTDNTYSVCKKSGLKNLRYHKADSNLGVAGGRNLGARIALYEYMLFIDDDAHFVSNDAVDNAYAVMSSTPYSIYAFNALRKDGVTPFMWTYKHPLGSHRFETATFIGCAHGIKKSAFETLGGYTEGLMWGCEENEIVMKAFSRDMGPVLYDDSVSVIHRVTSAARTTSNNNYYVCRNRLYLIRNYFPFSFGFFSIAYAFRNLLFSAKYGFVKVCLTGFRDSFKMKCDGKYRMNYRQAYKYLCLK